MKKDNETVKTIDSFIEELSADIKFIQNDIDRNKIRLDVYENIIKKFEIMKGKIPNVT